MARYCGEKGTICAYANENNLCSITACCRHDIGSKTISISPTNVKIGRACEICGRGTEDINIHICDECAYRLKKLIYNK